MISQELMEAGVRVGFEVCDLASGKKGWLAHVRQTIGPRVGKYRVNIGDLNSVGVTAIRQALKEADVVLIDEIGPMELCSEAFIEAVEDAADGAKPALITVHSRAQDQLIKQVRSRKDAETFETTLENRRRLPDLLANMVIDLMGSQYKGAVTCES